LVLSINIPIIYQSKTTAMHVTAAGADTDSGGHYSAGTELSISWKMLNDGIEWPKETSL
jgi:hypothetical protein